MKDGESSTEKYRLTIKDVKISVTNVSFDPKIRGKWISAIEQSQLRQNLQVDKQSFFSLKTGTRSARFPTIFNWGSMPVVLVLLFVKEKTNIGDFENNCFSYKDPGIQSVSVFVNGVGRPENTQTVNMEKIKRNSKSHMYWYKKFQMVFGKTAQSISPSHFLDDLFCCCYNLSPNLTPYGEGIIKMDPSQRKLSPISAASIDVGLDFHEPLSCNWLLYCLAWWDIEVCYNLDGIPMES